MKLKIKKGDMVKVIAGKGKTSEGTHRVLEVYPEKMRILVEGVNMRTVHTRPNQQNQQGGRIKVEKPIHYSNVQLVDSDGKPTRVGVRFADPKDRKTKVRYAKTNGKDL